MIKLLVFLKFDFSAPRKEEVTNYNDNIILSVCFKYIHLLEHIS